jgi:phosphoglycolate phosphatase-like HAD superfamily hydrolase
LKSSRKLSNTERITRKPIVLLEGVEETLEALHGKYKLVVATKGDLLDHAENYTIQVWVIIFTISK